MHGFKLTKPKLALLSLLPLFTLLLPVISIPLAKFEAVSPRGQGGLEFMLFLLFALLFALLGLAWVISAVCSPIPSIQSGAQISLAVCSVSIACLFGGSLIGSYIGRRIEWKALEQLAERSRPLLAAIEAYEKKFGQPPDSLEKLMPDFLPAIPSTGIGTTPEYQYSRALTDGFYGSNKWVLEVRQFGFNTFIYLPRQNYSSAFSHGHVVRRIGDWAYWHQG